MTEYQSFKLKLSKPQRESVIKAVKNKSPVVLRLTKDQVSGGDYALPLTKRQIQHLERNSRKNMGTQLTLSKSGLRKVRSGGFLPLLLALFEGAIELAPVIASAVAGMAAEAAPAAAAAAAAGVASEAGKDLYKEVTGKKGEGVAADVVKIVKVAGKKLGKAGAKTACKVAAKSIKSDIASSAVESGCTSLVQSVIGDGHKKKPGGKRGRPKKSAGCDCKY